MSGLAVRNKNGEKVHYTGSQFEGLENVGVHHLCVRTGAGADGVKKYGLTSSPLNDEYKCLKMRIPNSSNSGKYAYIAQKYFENISSVSNTYTASKSSNYIESTTLTIESKSSLNTKATTRASNYVSSTTLSTASSSKTETRNATRVSTHAPIYYASSGNYYTVTMSSWTSMGSIGKVLYNKNLTIYSSFLVMETSNTWATTQDIVRSATIVSSSSYKSDEYNDVHVHTLSCLGSGAKLVTRTQTSRVSNYVTSTTLSTASSSKLSTGNATRSSNYTHSETITYASSSELITQTATRSSEYTTSSSALISETKITHNVNL